MFREIIELANQADYDFRRTASPDDQLQYLFDEWVPYYRVKWAIARYLRPARILEIGVRYGYSALAFLDACPSAHYVGIDLDGCSYGGAEGAIEWARRQTSGYRADLIIADSQTFDRFPGGRYDLVHIDGQQDEVGFQHDMQVAIGQASYILVDGYFWTRDNFLAASEFLFRNRDLIEFSGAIPGYAGDLLVAVKKGICISGKQAATSGEVRDAYTRHYYLEDCGGFDAFKRTRGVKLEDRRLQTVAQLACLTDRGRALDLGCGRGELSIALAMEGFETTAIDYSPDAIALARSAKDAACDASLKISFVCSELQSAPLEGIYDAVVAADLIEHLGPEELDKLYERIADHLCPNGLFVIHTFPNKWFYRYEHARKRRMARTMGAYLPEDPRTRYERLMHINEQSPRVLRRQLLRYFPNVLVWFSDHATSNPYENLRRKFSISEMRQSGDLFAIATKRPLDVGVLAANFRMEPATQLSKGDLVIQVLNAPGEVHAGSSFAIDLLLQNRSSTSVKSFPPNPVHLSYHWIDAASSKVAIFDGERTTLDPFLSARSERRYRLFVRTPLEGSDYLVRATLVQESTQWLDGPPVEVFADIPITVLPARSVLRRGMARAGVENAGRSTYAARQGG